MRTYRRIIAVVGLLTLSARATAQHEAAAETTTGISASVGLVSDYRFRGVSLSKRNPALQAGVEYSHRSGIFGGIWGSSLPDDGGADVELDLYAGYSSSAAGLTYTVTGLRYFYPGNRGVSYVELQSAIEAPVGPFTLGAELAYTPGQDNAVSNLYTAATGSFEGPHGLTFSARLGRENGAYDRKWDWEVGLSRDLGRLSLRAAYVRTIRRVAGLGDEGKPTILTGADLKF